MKTLTRRQSEILHYIDSFQETNGYAPSYRELMQAFGLSSVASIFKHIKTLEAKGKLRQEEGKWRSITLVAQKIDEHGKHASLPIIGALAKGQKLELYPQVDTVTFSPDMIPTDLLCYAFVIKNDSFQNFGLLERDCVAVTAQEMPKNGALVIATLIQNDMVVIGSFSEENVTLISDEMSYHQSMLKIHGVIIAMQRKYH